MTVLHAVLQRYRDVVLVAAPELGDWPAITFLTPRFQTSRNVIGLVAAHGTGETRIVAKLPRRAQDEGALGHEAAALRTLAELVPSARGVPRLIAMDDAPGFAALLETAVPGRRLTNREVVVRRTTWINRILEWTGQLARLDRDPTAAASEAPPIGEVLETALGAWARCAGVDAALDRAVDDARHLLAPLYALDPPPALEHGDLAPPNLLVLPGGELGVVDWELAGVSRVPLHDLAFYLTHVAWISVGGPPERRLDTVDGAFLAGSRWALPALEARGRELGIAADHVPLLVLACWTRYAADTLRRLAAAGGQRAGGPAAELKRIRPLRAFTVWRHLISRLARRGAG